MSESPGDPPDTGTEQPALHLPFGDKYPGKGQQMILMPVLSLEQLHGGVAQSVNGRLEDMNGSALAGNGERSSACRCRTAPFVVPQRFPGHCHSGNTILVVSQKHGAVVFPGFKEQIIFQTVADNDVVDTAAFQIAEHGVRVAVPLRGAAAFLILPWGAGAGIVLGEGCAMNDLHSLHKE